jgi:hypothetical protein
MVSVEFNGGSLKTECPGRGITQYPPAQSGGVCVECGCLAMCEGMWGRREGGPRDKGASSEGRQFRRSAGLRCRRRRRHGARAGGASPSGCSFPQPPSPGRDQAVKFERGLPAFPPALHFSVRRLRSLGKGRWRQAGTLHMLACSHPRGPRASCLERREHLQRLGQRRRAALADNAPSSRARRSAGGSRPPRRRWPACFACTRHL